MDIFSASRQEIAQRKAEQARKRAAEARKRSREAFYRQVEREEQGLGCFSEQDEGTLFKKHVKQQAPHLAKGLGKYTDYNIGNSSHPLSARRATPPAINSVYGNNGPNSSTSGCRSGLAPSNAGGNGGSLMQQAFKK